MDKIWEHVSDKTQIDITVGSTDVSSFDVESIEIEKEINRIPRATIVMYDGDITNGNIEYSHSDSTDFDPGKTIEIKGGYREGGKPKLIFKGIITEHSIQKSRHRYGVRLIIKCKHEAYKMAIGRKVRYFEENKKDSEVFGTIISDNYSPLKSTVEATTYQHSKLVQYNSTDWDFILSRADVCGFVVIAGDEEITIGKPKVSETAKYEVDGGDVLDFSARLNGENHHLKGFSGQIWDSTKEWTEKPYDSTLEKTGEKNSDIKEEKLSEIKKQDTPILLPNTSLLVQEEIQGWADAALLKTQMAQLRGTATFYGTPIALGDVIKLSGVGKKFNKEVYVTQVIHRIKNAEWKTSVKFGLSSEWYHESRPNINTPKAAGLLPPINGIQLGVVTKLEGDPDGQSRIQVVLPFTGTEETKMELWARFVQPYASGESGFFFIPEIGDEVLIGFLNDDPRFPIVLGSLYSKSQNKVPTDMELADANTNKIIKTRGGMKIAFFENFAEGRTKDEDTEVEKKITIETSGDESKGHRIILTEEADGKKGTIKIENKNEEVTNFILLDENGISISSSEGKDIIIEAKENLTLKGKEITIEAEDNINLKATETINDAKLTVKDASEFKAGTFNGNVEITGKVDIK